MPVRVTVGLVYFLPFFMIQVVCCVRLTQKVIPDFLALQAATFVLARRLATSNVVGPASPAAGLTPYRCWNFLIAAQSAADCLPSTVTVPKPPSFLRYVSTCF